MTTASQVEALSGELNVFFGKNPLESKDLSSIINAYHFDRLMKLLNDVSRENIVHGGQWDRANLWVIRCGLILFESAILSTEPAVATLIIYAVNYLFPFL